MTRLAFSFGVTLVFSVLAATSLQAQCEGHVPGPQSASLLATVILDGEPASQEDELYAIDAQGQCLGTTNMVLAQGLSFVNLTIYGDDATTGADEGISDGETFWLELLDVSEGIVLSVESSFDGVWFNTNGAPLAAWSDPYQVIGFNGPTSCPEDFNGSGVIEVGDLLDLLSVYGSNCGSCAEDLDNTGTVEVNDLLTLLSSYGTSC